MSATLTYEQASSITNAARKCGFRPLQPYEVGFDDLIIVGAWGTGEPNDAPLAIVQAWNGFVVHAPDADWHSTLEEAVANVLEVLDYLGEVTA